MNSSHILARLNAATELPTLKAMELVIGGLVAMALLALPVRSFLEPSAPPRLPQALLMLLRCALFPSAVEEVFWRVLLLPNVYIDGAGSLTWGMLGQMTPTQWLWACACLALFVLYHIPFGYALARLGALRDDGRTFRDPRFIWLALVLGTACSMVYLVSGNYWACVLVHWLPVCIWLLLLGGEQRLRCDTSSPSNAAQLSAQSAENSRGSSVAVGFMAGVCCGPFGRLEVLLQE
eukprot:s2744_g18.t1